MRSYSLPPNTNRLRFPNRVLATLQANESKQACTVVCSQLREGCASSAGKSREKALNSQESHTMRPNSPNRASDFPERPENNPLNSASSRNQKYYRNECTIDYTYYQNNPMNERVTTRNTQHATRQAVCATQQEDSPPVVPINARAPTPPRGVRSCTCDAGPTGIIPVVLLTPRADPEFSTAVIPVSVAP